VAGVVKEVTFVSENQVSFIPAGRAVFWECGVEFFINFFFVLVEIELRRASFANHFVVRYLEDILLVFVEKYKITFYYMLSLNLLNV
jgi:hypothetical protein